LHLLPLPFQVKSSEGQAKWISDSFKLEVTLPLNRAHAFLYET
jgi:hypothetical protein